MKGEEWPDRDIDRLTQLWETIDPETKRLLSTAEIGRRLGRSKNAVVGKAHRLDLPARPSPILRDRPRSSAKEKRDLRRNALATGTLPSLLSVTVPVPKAIIAPAATRPIVIKEPVKPKPIAAAPIGRVISCCWPVEAMKRSYRFCDAPSVPGKPYCPVHNAIAYVKMRDLRDVPRTLTT